MQHARLPTEENRHEVRQKVLLRGQVRADALPFDVCIRDISSRGLLLQAATPPKKGSVIEVLVGNRSIVGRVRWSGERRFGVHVSPPICLEALLNATSRQSDSIQEPVRKNSPARSGRDAVRGQVQRAEMARAASSRMQFISIVGIAAAAGIWLSDLILQNATRATDALTPALRSGQQPERNQ